MKLHLGCWHRYIPGFVHIDLCDMDHIDYKADISDLSMFNDDTVDLIYSSHSFEYYPPQEAPLVLKEWYRVLRQGGKLRLAVPDFESLTSLYLETGSIKTVLGPIYGLMEISTSSGTKMLSHKTAYDERSLTALLYDCGFKSVERYRWQDTIHKDYDDHSQAYYPHMDKEKGKLLSLNLEAVK